MGLDFARSATGKACPKRWNGGANKLKAPTLFDLTVTEKERNITVSLHANTTIQLGVRVVVRVVEDTLIVCEDYKEIGRVDKPSDCVKKAMMAQCGIAEATVERVGLFGNNAELCLK